MSKRQMLFFLLMLCLLMLALFSNGCGPRKYGPGSKEADEFEQMPLTRADPAYLQYLERQSMLSKSTEMAKVVSGSELAWRAPGGGGVGGLLSHADTWLLVHPMTILTSSRNAVFSQLSQSSTWPMLREVGVKGLYVAPIQGGGAIWAKERKSPDTGDDVVQYEFSRVAGKDDQYRRLMSGVIDNNGLLGSDLVPAATGLGPDFFLAARAVREYPGVYCMVEIPEDLWPNLPAVASEWEGAALSQAQIDVLNAKGLLPRAMRDETSFMARSGGWAATGAIRGVDGNQYRWVYRYYQNPSYAVLNWEDPSQTAHRILSGSAVRQVGLQGQALLGLRFEAFQGLDPAPEGRSRNVFSVEPARTAAQSMGREISRFGGWSWVRDDGLPLASLRDYLSTGLDCIFDSAFSPAAEHALLTGDATLLRFMADETLRLGIDGRRLVHVMPAQDGINYSLPHLAYLAAGSGGERAAAFRQSVQGAMRAAAAQAGTPLTQDNRLYTTGAGLAALALGAGTPEAAQGKLKDIASGHSLLIFFKAMQPGVMMLAGQDLSGVLPLGNAPGPAYAARGSYGLSSSSDSLVVTNLGMPRAPRLYPPADIQVHEKGSFLSRIGAFLKARSEYGIGKGTLAARPATKGKGSVALLTRLPGGASYLLSVCNFSRSAVTETISLGGHAGMGQALSRVTPIATGGSHAISGQTVTITLGPWQGRALLLGKGSAKAVEGGEAEQTAEEVTPIPAAPAAPVEKPVQKTERQAKQEPAQGKDAAEKGAPASAAREEKADSGPVYQLSETHAGADQAEANPDDPATYAPAPVQ